METMEGTETKVALNANNISHLEAQMKELKEIFQWNSDEFKCLLEKILKQAEYTNGRVTKLELWRNYTMGFAAAISTVLALFGIKIF